jgi:hypothetical protein
VCLIVFAAYPPLAEAIEDFEAVAFGRAVDRHSKSFPRIIIIEIIRDGLDRCVQFLGIVGDELLVRCSGFKTLPIAPLSRSSRKSMQSPSTMTARCSALLLTLP